MQELILKEFEGPYKGFRTRTPQSMAVGALLGWVASFFIGGLLGMLHLGPLVGLLPLIGLIGGAYYLGLRYGPLQLPDLRWLKVGYGNREVSMLLTPQQHQDLDAAYRAWVEGQQDRGVRFLSRNGSELFRISDIRGLRVLPLTKEDPRMTV